MSYGDSQKGTKKALKLALFGTNWHQFLALCENVRMGMGNSLAKEPLHTGNNPRSPMHPRSFAIVASQYGRVGTLSNQFGELLVVAVVPDAVVIALVGHESSAMSHRYTHIGKEALSRAAKTFPAI
jgi:hypothetical protein